MAHAFLCFSPRIGSQFAQGIGLWQWNPGSCSFTSPFLNVIYLPFCTFIAKTSQLLGSPNRSATSPQANVASAASTKDDAHAEANPIWCVCVCVCVLRTCINYAYMLESISSSFTGRQGRHWLSFAETKIFWLGGSQQIWIPSTSSISQSNAIVKISFSGEPTGRNIGQLWFLRSSGTICSGGGWVLMNNDLHCQDFKVYTHQLSSNLSFLVFI